MKKLMNKFFAVLFGIVITLIGLCFANPTCGSVLASDGTSSEVYCELMDISSYRDLTNGNTAPKPTDKDHLDWIFAGWFYDEECTEAVGIKATSGERWAKFVPADVLSVKCQVTEGTTDSSPTSDMRLVSTVESSKIYRIGFNITIISKDAATGEITTRPLQCLSDIVYEKIKATSDGVAYKYSPNVFDVESTYFSTLTITGIPTANFDDAFVIEPYWITKDNTTVYGVSRYARVSDSYNNIVNIPVRLYSNAEVAAGDVLVTFDNEAFSYVGYDADEVLFTTTGAPTVDGSTVTCSVSGDSTKADGMVVNLRFKAIDGQTLKTLNPRYSFTVSGVNFKGAGETEVAAPNAPDISYRNLAASSTSAYTDWYDKDAAETGKEYVLATAPELYGLGELSKSYTFANDTIYIAGDIAVNQGTPITEEEWDAFDTSDLTTWTRIGSKNYPFAGKFYGQQHTVSGVYYNGNLTIRGFFGAVNDATIQDFELRNSYIASNQTELGSIVGTGSFQLSGIYSNAVVVSSHSGTNTYVGGFVGRVTDKSTISNCLFEGTVVAKNAQAIGGMVGCAGASLTMEHCCYNGNIYSANPASAPRVGGFCGDANNVSLTLNDSLYSGDIIFEYATNEDGTKTTSLNQSGVIVGRYTSSSFSADKVYTDTINVEGFTVTTEEETGETTVKTTDVKLGYANKSSNTIGGVSLVSDDLTGFGGVTVKLDYTTNDGNADFWVLRKNDTPTLRTFATSGCLYTPDTNCYDEETKTYTIADAGDLYGLAKLSVDGETFDGATIELATDITVNEGESSDWSTDAPMYDWIPIGTGDAKFKGTFEGQGCTISGIYLNSSENNQGLFGYVASPGIRNFRLENSHFVSSGKVLASIAGRGYAVFEKIYSNADIVDTCNAETARIAGVIGVATDGSTTIEQCWFAGTIDALAQEVGGIVGTANHTVNIKHCLNTGTITNLYSTKGPRTGGICGTVNSGKTLTIIDTLNAGSLVFGEKTDQCGIVIGYVSGTANATNVYATTNKILQNNEEKSLRYSQGTIGEEGVTLVSGDFTGFGGVTADLDYNAYWALRTNDMPILRTFATSGCLYTPDTSCYNAETNTYTIADVGDLYGLAKLSNVDKETFSGATIKVVADINVNEGDSSDWSTDAPMYDWLPIGTSDAEFQGTFDGQGYTINGIYLNSDAAEQGLFGYVASPEIKNFRLENSYFESSGQGLASIAARGYATFENIYSKAVIVNTYNGAYARAAGIIGTTRTDTTKINNCWFDGTINATGSYVGGFIGQVAYNVEMKHCLNTGDITNAYSAASRTGGICGYVNQKCDLTISDSLNAGTLSLSNINQCGIVIGKVDDNGTANATDVYATTNYIVQDGEEKYLRFNDGIVGGEGITPVSGDIKGEIAKTNAADLDYTEHWAVVPNDIPTLQVLRADTTWYAEATGIASDEVNDPYIIMDTADLYGLELLSRTTDFAGKTIQLGADIVVNKDTPSTFDDWTTYLADNSLSEWIPIGSSDMPFTGTFDGKDHTISGLYINSTKDNQGLFGVTSEGEVDEDTSETVNASVVQNFKLKNSYIKTSGAGIGSIAGLGGGTFAGIYSEAIVVNTGDETEGTGGIVGKVSSLRDNIISNCWFTGTAQTDYRGVGGIVGTVVAGNLTIEHCYSSGSLIKTATQSTAARMGGICGSVLTDTTTSLISNLTIKDTLSVAELTSLLNNNQLGTVVGIIETHDEDSTLNSVLYADAVYSTVASQEEYTNYVGTGIEAWDSNNGQMDWTLNSNMSGYGALTHASRLSWKDPTEGTDNTDNYWVARNGELPILAKFWDGEGDQLDPSDVITADSEDHGDGHLVEMTLGATKQSYDDCIESLKSSGYTCVYENTLGGTVFTATYQNEDAKELYVTVTYTNAAYSADSEEYDVTYARLYKAYSSYVNFSPHLTEAQSYTADDAYTIENGTTKLYMLDLVQEYGNSFVMQLDNGHFIVNDGGRAEDLEGLITFMQGKTDGKKPVIEAWVISHSHDDHSNVLKQLVKDAQYRDSIYVEGIYYNSPGEASFDKDEVSVRANDAYVKKVTAYLTTTAGAGTHPRVYRPMTGQQYFFGNVTMDVVLSQDQITVSSYQNGYNETSTWVKYSIEEQDVLIGGDSGQAGMKAVSRAYTQDYLTIDVFAALHHGKNTWNTFTNYCTIQRCVLYTQKRNRTSYLNHVNDPYWEKEIIDANRKLVGLDVIDDLSGYDDVSRLDTTPTIPYFYLNNGTVTLEF